MEGEICKKSWWRQLWPYHGCDAKCPLRQVGVLWVWSYRNRQTSRKYSKSARFKDDGCAS